jgi:radical SAM protein with 4Fe4S-binding SPASM domain
VWEITLACNARCVHCGSSAGAARPRELTTQEATALVDELASLGCRTITLSGGEPLLREDWPVIARAARGRGMTVDVITNGLLAAARADAIARAGLAGVSFSIDGPAPLHDEMRGVDGALERLLRGAAALKSRGVRIGAVTQVNRLNVSSLGRIHDLLAERGFEAWQIQLTLPHGRAAERERLCLEPGEMPPLEKTIVGLVRRGVMHVEAADTIGWMSRAEPLLRSGGPRGHKVWGSCQAGLRAVGITSDGTVRGCLSMPPRFDEGNLRERSLSSIWSSPDAFAYNRKFSVDDLEGACAACAFASICRGGCTCLAWTATGKTTSNPFCLRSMERRET